MRNEKLEAYQTELAQRYLGGDDAAASELMASLDPLIRTAVRYALKFCPRFRHLSDDLISEGMLAMWKRIRRKRLPPPNFRNAVITTVRRALDRMIDRKEALHIDQVPFVQLTSHERALARSCPQLEAFEMRDFIFAQCQTDMERNVLKRYLEGYSVGETARHLGVHRNTVTTTYRRIKQRIQTVAAA
jgi:RNA polymerase sigma factor (sigma-70 family)